MDKRVSQRDIGNSYEMLAGRHLEQAGLVFEAANVTVTLGSGEINIIMRDRKTWIFVEVRFRRNNAFCVAAASVTWSKQQGLCHAAALWLSKRSASFDTVPCRFDVIAITGNQLEWLPNAFNADR